MDCENIYRDRYRILRKLGEGGSSTVYMAIDEQSGRTVTVKAFKETVLSGGDVIEAVKEETAILKKLDHPSIPKVVEVYEDAFVLEHIPGNSLDKVMKSRGALSEKEAVRIGLEILDILEYLHGLVRPVIYRDLKPANIIIKPDGHVAMIDFGAAREYRPEDEADTINLGTCGFAAPEQYGSLGQTDDRTDIYCFGRTLMQMMTASTGSGKKLKSRSIISPELQQIIEKCTRPDREDRFSSCREIEKALHSYPKKTRVRKVVRNLKIAVVAAILALAVTMTATYYDTVRSYAAEDAKARIPAVKERLGYAGLRIGAALEDEFGVELK